jgi:surface antigen
MIWAAGCAGPSQLGSFAGYSDANDITSAAAAGPLGDLPLLLSGDLAAAQAAAAALLEQDGQASAPWRNPDTGAHGTITPVAAAYHQGGEVCRDFLGTYVQGKAESWLHGEACQDLFGHWQVRGLRRWLRS